MLCGDGGVHPTCRQIKKKCHLNFQQQLALGLRSQTKLLATKRSLPAHRAKADRDHRTAHCHHAARRHAGTAGGSGLLGLQIPLLGGTQMPVASRARGCVRRRRRQQQQQEERVSVEVRGRRGPPAPAGGSPAVTLARELRRAGRVDTVHYT